MDEIRLKRIEGELREHIAGLILDGAVKDPRVGPFVSVTRVEAARDLSTARVFVSVFGVEAEPEPDGRAAEGRDPLALAVEGLQSAAGFIQSQVARKMRTRLTPRLHFIADKGIKEGFELTERIKGLFT